MKTLTFCFSLIGLVLLIFVEKSFSEIKLLEVDNSKWTKKYDDYFKKYSKRFFSVGFDYRWFKSQAIAESKLKADAKSWVGAKGLMQIMPKTFEDIKKRNPSFRHVFEPRWNIAAGIFYDRKMYNFWKEERPFLDKIGFAFASYNAGARNILKGQKRCKEEKKNNCNRWSYVKLYGSKVKTWRHKETIHYIKEIFKLMDRPI